MSCIAGKPSSCKSKTYYVATYLYCQSMCQISVSTRLMNSAEVYVYRNLELVAFMSYM